MVWTIKYKTTNINVQVFVQQNKSSYLIFFMNKLHDAMSPKLEFAEVDKLVHVMLQW